jgi:hypothetical protein
MMEKGWFSRIGKCNLERVLPILAQEACRVHRDSFFPNKAPDFPNKSSFENFLRKTDNSSPLFIKGTSRNQKTRSVIANEVKQSRVFEKNQGRFAKRLLP